MKRIEFEHLLCAAGALSPEKEFVVFGSQADRLLKQIPGAKNPTQSKPNKRKR